MEVEPITLRIQVCTRGIIGCRILQVATICLKWDNFSRSSHILSRNQIKTVMGMQMHPGIGGRPVIRLCASNQSKYGIYKEKGRGINVWDQCFLFFCLFFSSLTDKLLDRKQSRVILAGLLWFQLSRSPLKTITIIGRLSKHLENIAAEHMQYGISG